MIKKHLLLTIALLCMVVQGAWAADYSVGTESDLKEKVQFDNANITLTADITLSEKLTIGSSKTVTIDLNGHKLDRGTPQTESFNMVIYVSGGNLTINDKNDNSGQITGGRSYNGAGILCETGSTLTINGGTFKNNHVSSYSDGSHGRGGAILMNPNSTLTINGGVFENNSAYKGGAICNEGTATISGASFTGNTASYCGGAIYNSGTLTINSGTVSGTSPYGGAVYNTGSFTMAGGTISNSESTKGGGGGLVNIGTVEISGGTFSGNTAKTDGGGIWNGNSGSAHGTLTITGGEIKNNTAKNYGGGIWNENVVTITNCEISGNKGDDGGGIYNKADGNVTINSGTTFSGNTSENHSGGAINNHGKLTVNDGSFTSNTAKNYGGAIGNFDSGVLTINGGTFTGNSVTTYYGGGVYIGSGTFNLSGSVNITSNTANSKTDNLYLYSDNIINITGALTSSSNKIGVTLEGYDRDFTSGFRSKNSDAQPSDFFTSDVNYASLSLNGNEAKLTITSGLTYIERAWEGGNTDGKVVSKTKRCDSYSTYNGQTSLSSGWYLLSGSHSYDFRLVVHGPNTYFILEDGCNIEFKKGIHIDNPRTLTIYAQSGGTGKLRATGSGSDANAAIGGNEDQMSGYLVIHGGTIEASSSKNNAAAIGGGNGSSSGMQSVTIYGGTVTATGKSSGAGIGGGQENSTPPNITIYGGTITATGGSYAAGIGGGEETNGGTITIYGGEITATGGDDGSNNSWDIYGGGAGIGGGENADGGTFIMYGGKVTATGGKFAAGIGGGDDGDGGTITIYGGTVNATSGEGESNNTGGDDGGAAIGSGDDGDSGTITIYGGNVTATGNTSIGIGADKSSTINIYGGTVYAYGKEDGSVPIGVRNGTLNFKMTGGNVTAETQGNTTTYGGAGIGGPCSENVMLNITIDGGTVNATGGPGGAGIGAGSYRSKGNGGGDIKSGSTITINGGIVTATGDKGAGIGAGYGGNNKGTITINGGTVTAKGESGGAGIGCGKEEQNGNGGNAGTININGGKVTAEASGTDSGNDSQAIGYGKKGDDTGSLTIANDLCVKSGNGKETYTSGNRVSKCRDHAKRIIEVCEHNGKCTNNNDGSTHAVNCTYCLTSGNENHTYGSDGHTCTRCGYEIPDPKTITIYEANSTGTGYGTATTHQVQYGKTYTLPDCSSVPNNMWFAGWKETIEQPTGIQADGSEFSSLKSAGTEIEVKSDLTYYARYHTTVWPGGGNGTAGDPYLISTEDDWNELVNAVSNKNFDFSGRYLKLTADISVTEMVGTSSNRFRGTFDGDGHTLTVSYSSSEEACAPFRYTYGATIQNLKIAGTIATSGTNAGGVVGKNFTGRLTLDNVISGVTINSSKSGAANHGGLVGYAINANIEGCAFIGKLLGANSSHCGGLLGYKSATGGSSVTIRNSLFLPTEVSVGTDNSYTFGAGTTDKVSITNCFYTETLGEAQGTQAYTVQSGTSGLSLDYGSASANYGNGTLKTYSFDQGDETTAGGLLYDDVLYTGGNTKVTFTPESSNGQQPALSTTSGTLAGNSDGTYTLTMNNANATVTATAYSNYDVTLFDGSTNTETISGNRGHIADVTISGRTLFKDGSWNTFCVPFDMTAAQVTDQLAPSALMELDVDGTYDEGKQTGFDDGTLYLYFKNATAIEAGKPYIIKWTSGGNLVNPEFTGVTINSSVTGTVTSADDYISFVGNFDPVTIGASGDDTMLYLGNGNTLYYPSGKKDINSFRAYFQLNNGLTAGNVTSARMFFGIDEETTGIVEIDSGILNMEHSAAAGWYDMQGRKLSGKPTQKGLYIYNGRKYAIK